MSTLPAIVKLSSTMNGIISAAYSEGMMCLGNLRMNYIYTFTEISSYPFCVTPQPIFTNLISETKPSFSVSILKEARWKGTDSTFMLTLHCPTSSAATGSCPHLHSKPPSGMGTPTVERERPGRFHWQFPSSLQKGGSKVHLGMLYRIEVIN